MVVYSDIDNSILEFCKICKHVNRSGSFIGTEMDSQAHPHEHLMIVFFDALRIDDDMVISQKYQERRRRLKELLFHSPGPSPTADWGSLDFARLSSAKATEKLERLFSKAISQRREGLILKPCDGPYFSLSASTSCQHGGRIIKLKKDAIAGLGDTADFAIIGANYNVVEAHKLQSKNMKWTNFTLACLENKDEVLRFQARPRYMIMGTVAHPCVSVEDISHLCMVGQFSGEPFLCGTPPSKFDLTPSDVAVISVVFQKPFVVEVLGSGFDKPLHQSFYMLRHARVIKIHQDRMHADIISFNELQELARQAINIPDNLKQEEAEWLERLHVTGTPKRPKYLKTSSPFSQATTESPLSTKASPYRTSRKTSSMTLVRMDTSEMLPTESRHALGTPIKKQPRVNAGSIIIHELPTPPKSSAPINAQDQKHGQVTAVKELGKRQKRALDETEISSADGRPRKKTTLGQRTRNDSREAAGVTSLTTPYCKHDPIRGQPDERADGKIHKRTLDENTHPSKAWRFSQKPVLTTRAGNQSLKTESVLPAVTSSRTIYTASHVESKPLADITNSPPKMTLRELSITPSMITTSLAMDVNRTASKEASSSEDQTANSERHSCERKDLAGETVSLVEHVSIDMTSEVLCDLSGLIAEEDVLLKPTKTIDGMTNRTDEGCLENKQWQVYLTLHRRSVAKFYTRSPTGAEMLPLHHARLSVAVDHLTADIQKPVEDLSPISAGHYSHNAAFESLTAASYDDKMSKPNELSSPLSGESSASFYSASAQPEEVDEPYPDRALVSAAANAPLSTYFPEILSFPSPFQNHTFYLSPCISSTPYLTQNLVPLLDGQHTPASVSHWDRDIQPHLTPCDPVVSESQAYVGLQKAALVESRRIQPTADLAKKLMKLHLAKGEVIELWDWRVAEGLAEITEHLREHLNITSVLTRTGLSTSEAAEALRQTVVGSETWAKAERALAASYVGCVRFDATSKLNDHEAADVGAGLAAAAKWIGSCAGLSK